MKRNFFLTSVLVLAGLMQPAVAETFPADGYMLEDKTYENAATYTNTGVYEGTVNATAEYTDNIYKIAAGSYLPQNSEAAAPCTAGYYCPGKADAMYSESGDQGITACPGGYPNSAAGAGAENQCYTACTLATANIAHATGVSGNDYYGDGTDTCVATECELGYHVNESVSLVAKTPVISVDYTVAGDGMTANVDPSGTVEYWLCKEGDGCTPATSADFDAGLTEPNTWAARFDYGTVYGRASCQPTINPGLEYLEYNTQLLMTGEMTFEEFESGLAAIIGAGKAAYATNVLREALSAMEGGDEAEISAAMELATQMQYVLFNTEPDLNYSTDSEGQYCYCQTTGYTPTGGNFVEAAAASWVQFSFFEADGCVSGCAQHCAIGLRHNDVNGRGLRAALFGSFGTLGGGTCDANEITINWTDAEEIGDAGMCKYGGDIKTPVKAVTKKGKTFKGWRFEKTN